MFSPIFFVVFVYYTFVKQDKILLRYWNNDCNKNFLSNDLFLYNCHTYEHLITFNVELTIQDNEDQYYVK